MVWTKRSTGGSGWTGRSDNQSPWRRSKQRQLLSEAGEPLLTETGNFLVLMREAQPPGTWTTR